MGNFEKKLEVFWKVFYEYGGYTRVLTGLRNTIYIAVAGLVIGIIIGTIIAVIAVFPKYKRLPRILDGICKVYVGFSGVSHCCSAYALYFVALPLFGSKMPSLNVCMIVFGLNSGAYVSEIMRSGILSVDPGQLEAARALGLSYGISMLKVVVPQAIKNILPTLGNEFIVLIKETSVVSFVGAADLYVAFNYIGTNSYEFMVPYLAMALIYIVLVMFIAMLVKIMERSLRKSDRHN